MDKKLIESLFGDINTVYLHEIDSTNSEAKRRALGGEQLPMLIISEKQTAGRGRLGRSFYSPEKTGLYMSLAYMADADMCEAVKITSAAAVAASLAIEELCDSECMIKWVNDVYINDKKVCGILTEATAAQGGTVIVLGIGVNCTTEIFPDDISDRAASVGISDREVLAQKICKYALEFISGKEFISEYRRRSLVLGREITYIRDGVEKTGVAEAIRDDGALILAGGTVLSSGKITIRF